MSPMRCPILLAGLVLAWANIFSQEVWQISNSSPTQANLEDVIYNGKQIVAVGLNGTILASQDGITWTSGSSATDKDLWSVVWTGKKYFTVGSQGIIVSSSDGINWQKETTGTLRNLYGITWTGKQIVVVGSLGTVLTSDDGTLWTLRNSGTSTGYLSKITWTDTLLVAVGNAGTILTSPDGINWTPRPSPASSHLSNVIWGNKTIVILGDGTFTSKNGVDWIKTMSNSWDNSAALTWTGEQFVGLDFPGKLITSTDGMTWLTKNYGPNKKVMALCWTGSKFIGVGDSGHIVISDPIIAHNINSTKRMEARFSCRYTKAHIYFNLPKEFEGQSIQATLFSANGKRILEQKLFYTSSQMYLPISGVPQGIYFLELKGAGQNISESIYLTP